MQPQDYMQQRVDEQIKWMETKSIDNQKKYKQIKVAEIVTAAAIPFLAGLQQNYREVAIITGILGVLLVVLNGMQQLYKYHENWIMYRGAIEILRREKVLYETQTGPYSDVNSFSKFVSNFEALLANENKDWKESSTPMVVAR